MVIKLRHFSPFFLIRAGRGLLASRKVTQRKATIPIRFDNVLPKLIIHKHPTASLVINGILHIYSYQGGNEPVSITMCEESSLVVDGDFVIGNGTSIYLDRGASLYIGGKREESLSGITEKSRIMARKNIRIGFDCIIAWNVFITDCDWHSILGREEQKDVTIGDHVWIACNVSILKGAQIGNNCVIGAHSVVTGKLLPDGSMAAGSPIRILAERIKWSRDII